MKRRCNSLLLFCLVFLWIPCAAVAATVTLPATGQTGCWDVNGAAVTCAGTGQDGDTLQGAPWPNPRFADNGDQSVTDNLTGLIWTKDGNPAASAKYWQEALDYVASLNSQNYLGYNDWRLPNRKELASLVNRQQADSVTWLNGQGFSNVQASCYWSSSSYAYYPYYAWGVLMVDVYVYDFSKINYGYVWPVRAGQSGGLGSLSISPTSKDYGTVTINTTSTAQTFTLSNTGTGNLVVSAITLTGGDSGMFTLATGDGTAGTCGATATIAAAASCTVSATFTPTSTGAKVTTLRIASDDPIHPTVDIALTGTGALPTYTVGTGAVGNGTVNCTPATVNSGDTSSCASTATTPGNHIATVSGCGISYSGSGNSDTSQTITTAAITGNCTVTGTFAINNYSVSFTSNGGSGVTSQSVAYNTTATAPANPTKTGYTFGGWYSDIGLTTAFAFTTHITAGTTLYAKWTINYSIADALQSLQSAAGIIALDQSQLSRLDVAPMFNGVSNGDGKIDIEDVIVLLRKAVGLL